jgi:hypothetical protein
VGEKGGVDSFVLTITGNKIHAEEAKTLAEVKRVDKPRLAQSARQITGLRFLLAACRKLLIVLCLYSSTQAGTSAEVDAIVVNMVRAYTENRSQLRPYVLTRRYRVFKSGEHKSTIIAAIIYLPPEANTFEIHESTGGKAEGVVRKLLQKEIEVARDFQASGFNIANYEFQLLGEETLDGAECYVLAIHPKRKSKDLLDGRIWLDKRLSLVRRVQGRPVKPPSWWVKNVSFTVDYGKLEGMWLQIGSSGEANVRFVGKYTIVSEKIAFALLHE